jgi:hypothetical protein
MEYAVEKGSGAMIYIPIFIKIGTSTQTAWWSHKLTFAFSKYGKQANNMKINVGHVTELCDARRLSTAQYMAR